MSNQEVLTRDLLKEMNIESLLSVTASDIEVLKELATVRAFMGQFTILKVSMQPSEGDNKGHIAMQYRADAIIEQEETNPHKLPDAEEGAIFTERFYPGYGIQRLAQIMGHCSPEGTTLMQFIESAEGINFHAMVRAKSRKDQDTKEVRYFNELDVFSMIGPMTPVEE